MRNITATVAGVSLAIGLAAPTGLRAEGNDIGRILAGIATVAIIAKIADDRRDRKRAEAAKTLRTEKPRQNTWRYIEDDLPRTDRSVRHHNPRRLALPSKCARRLQSSSHRGTVVYGARCLNRNYANADRLPRACQVRVQTDRGLRTAYPARCLRRDGWQVARR